MSTGQFWELGRVTDGHLLDGVRKLIAADRRVTARLLAHLSEVQERRLHLRQAKPTMFAYCLELGMSEDEAGRRLCAAGVARRFPVAYVMLDQGRLCLSVLCELKQYVSDDNHLEVLEGVSGLSYRRAQEWLARRFPRPDATSRIRKLPDRSTRSDRAPTEPVSSARSPQGVAAPTAQEPAALDTPPPRSGSSSVSQPGQSEMPQSAQEARDCPSPLTLNGESSRTSPSPGIATRDSVSDRGCMQPLAADRYRVQFTASTELKEKLELALDLTAHKSPSRDYAPVLERALDLLIADLEKRRFGKTSRPGRSRPVSPLQAATAQEPTKAGRVTNATKRAVRERDGLQCSYVDEHGRRCPGRAFLERDHRVPRGKGGGSGAANIRHLCRNHNQWLAEQEYGRDRIEQAKRAARQTRSHGGAATSRIGSDRSKSDVDDSALDTS
jgi:hypothetical protein